MAAARAKLLVVASMALAPSSWREKGGKDVERRRKEPEEGREGTLLFSSVAGNGGLRRHDGQTRTARFGHELAVGAGRGGLGWLRGLGLLDPERAGRQRRVGSMGGLGLVGRDR